MEGRGRLGDRLAGAAGELLPHVLDHLPGTRHQLQRLGDVLAELGQASRATAGAGRGTGTRTRSRGRCSGSGRRGPDRRRELRGAVPASAAFSAASSSSATLVSSSSSSFQATSGTDPFASGGTDPRCRLSRFRPAWVEAAQRAFAKGRCAAFREAGSCRRGW